MYDNTTYTWLSSNTIRSLSNNQLDTPNIEWVRREQALTYKMNFDMPCKCVIGCNDVELACIPSNHHAVYTDGNLTNQSNTFEANQLPNFNPRRWFLPSRWHIKPQKPKQSDVKTIKIQQTN
jgi:hypothetical protein